MNLLPIIVPLLPIWIYTNTAWPESDHLLLLVLGPSSIILASLWAHITTSNFAHMAGWLAGAEKSPGFMQGKGRQSSGTNKCVRSIEHLMPVYEL